ncbi:tyrosine-type recombinase/integrase [Rhizobium leguminosarum]|uniref:tyrosine-type recombinase/integrase n=1 Tax=Rhizobium leguminosarum TaxID=384 RepID=UPI001C94ACD9|nr:site-specific integrase [Rhizobium leguminosarum]MBY5563610.1 site-specific integrase [Rhizobium leguminosarum]
MKLNLRGIIEDTDRHGNVRRYYRIKGKKKVRLREKPGTAAFLREYECAEKGIPYGDSPVVSDSTKPVVARSFRWLCQQHFKRAANSVTVDTMSRRRRILEEICVKHGDKPFELLERKHVTAIRDTRIDSPGAANNIVKAISALFAWAIEVGEAKTNPCNGIKRLKSGDGFHTWTLEEIEQYEAKHPPGTTARRALAVFMFTGLRLSDAAILGRQHLNDGWIRIRPGKTRKSSGVEVNVPILPELAEELSVPAGQLTFLVTEYGKPFSDKGLGNKMRQWCDEAGLFHCSAHTFERPALRSPQRTAQLLTNSRPYSGGRRASRQIFTHAPLVERSWPEMPQSFFCRIGTRTKVSHLGCPLLKSGTSKPKKWRKNRSLQN